MTGIFIKRGNLKTLTGKMLCEDKGSKHGDASTSQGTSKIARKLPETGGDAWNRFSFTVAEATNLAVRSVRQYISIAEATVWGTLLQQL